MSELTELAARLRADSDRETTLANLQLGLAASYRAAGYEQDAEVAEKKAKTHLSRATLAAVQAERAVPFVHDLALALRALLDDYQALHDSGDAGTPLPNGSPVRVRAISALDKVGY